MKAVWVLLAVNIHTVNEDDGESIWFCCEQFITVYTGKKSHKMKKKKSGSAHKRLPVVEPCGACTCSPVVFQHLNSMMDSDDRAVNEE